MIIDFYFEIILLGNFKYFFTKSSRQEFQKPFNILKFLCFLVWAILLQTVESSELWNCLHVNLRILDSRHSFWNRSLDSTLFISKCYKLCHSRCFYKESRVHWLLMQLEIGIFNENQNLSLTIFVSIFAFEVGFQGEEMMWDSI